MVLSSAAGLVSLYIDYRKKVRNVKTATIVKLRKFQVGLTMFFQVMRSSDRDMERSEFSPTALE